MKRLLTILLLFIGFVSQAQVYSNNTLYGQQQQRSVFTTDLGIPYDTFQVPNLILPNGINARNYPHLAAKGDSIYLWSIAQKKWKLSASGGNVDSAKFNVNQLTIYRHGLSNITAAFDTSLFHTYPFYVSQFGSYFSANDPITYSSNKIGLRQSFNDSLIKGFSADVTDIAKGLVGVKWVNGDRSIGNISDLLQVIPSGSPTTGQIIRWNGSWWENWTPTYISSETQGLTSVLTNGNTDLTHGFTVGGDVYVQYPTLATGATRLHLRHNVGASAAAIDAEMYNSGTGLWTGTANLQLGLSSSKVYVGNYLNSSASGIQITNPTESSVLKGDMFYTAADNGVVRTLRIGTNGQLMRTGSSGLPEWFTPSYLTSSPTLQAVHDAGNIITSGANNNTINAGSISMTDATNTMYISPVQHYISNGSNAVAVSPGYVSFGTNGHTQLLKAQASLNGDKDLYLPNSANPGDTIATKADVRNIVGSGSPANLSLGTRTNTTIPVNNSNGTGITIPEADATHAGLVRGSLYDSLTKSQYILNTTKDIDSIVRVDGDSLKFRTIRVLAGTNIGVNRVVKDSVTEYTINYTGSGGSGNDTAHVKIRQVTSSVAAFDHSNRLITPDSLKVQLSPVLDSAYVRMVVSGGKLLFNHANSSIAPDTLNISVKTPVTLSSQYTDASNSGTTETDLMSYTVAASQLVNNGDRLEIEGWFMYAANANTKTLKFKFGSYVATIASSFVTSSGGSVKFRIVVTRTGATSQNIAYEFKPEFGTPTQGFSGGTETLSGTVVTKFTGTSGTASSDITQKTMTVTYYPL